MISWFVSKWHGRKIYNTFAEMPDSLLTFFGTSSFLVAGFYGYALGKFLPGYLDAANAVPFTDWGLLGWFLTAVFVTLGIMLWYFGSIAWRCNGLLRERWFA